MKTTDFSKVKFKSYKYYNRNANYNQKPLIGWDTETSNGQCGLLCNSNGQVLVGKDIDIILSRLTEEDYQKCVNVFYNLGYDYNAIFKCLPKENLKEIAKKNKTIYKDYEIQIIPHKMMSIGLNYIAKNGNEMTKRWKYFDLWQFFKYEKSSSLDSVSEKYLGEKKIDVEESGWDKSKFKFEDFYNDELQKYCIDDCVKTYKLGNIIIDSCKTVGLSFNQPYSCATLSMNYVYDLKGVKSPLWFYFNKPKNKKVFEYAFNSYSGGRFEVMQRGTFNGVYEYDVNSMYPKWICELQNIYKMDFEFCRNENSVDSLRDDETYYMFLRIKVKPNDKFINILPNRSEGTIIYPRSKKYFETYITLPELKLLEKYNVDHVILDGYVGTPDFIEYPYRDIFQEIYTARMKYPKSHFLSSLYKIIMNSFYGKTIEMNLYIDEDEKDASTCHDILDMVLDEKNEDIISRCYMAGKYFCSPYASMITSPSRCLVTESMLDAPEPEKNIVGCFTDSVVSLTKLDLPISTKMGEWEMHEYDELNMVGSGVYYLHSNNGDKKIRTRGFKFANMNDFSFSTFLSSDYPVNQILSLKQAIIQDNIDDFNVISEADKEININFDTKRKWKRDFKNVNDIFKSRIGSETLTL